ncbi:hypothetical protein [Waterburya agarophytonicola]|nr:hypothetical protein [Waterburya agarophytonicola]
MDDLVAIALMSLLFVTSAILVSALTCIVSPLLLLPLLHQTVS